MKKSLFTTLFAPVALAFLLTLGVVAGPVLATAQAYYGNYSNYSSAEPYNGCVNLTTYQGLGSTDAATEGQVSMLQIFLNQAGYLSGVSGTFDNGTYGAVINFQRAYGLSVTGIADPATRSVIDQQSCQNSTSGYIGSYQNSYPVTNYPGGSNCYWTGGTYDSTYVCTTAPIAPIVPVYPISPVICNNYGNGYNNNWNYGNGYNNNGYNNCNPYGVVLNSLSVSYAYNGATITITGSGFSNSGNTVYFGNSLISSNVYSPNGSTVTFTVPAGYYAGTYGITVKNASGYTSNSLSFTMNNNTGYNNNCNYNNGSYNNWNYGYSSNDNCLNNGNGNWNNTGSVLPTLSAITGPSNVEARTTNTWSVTTNGSNNGYVTLQANWGDGSTSNSNGSQNSYEYGNQSYSFSHEYLSGGSYTIRITATNNYGQSTYATYPVYVNGNGGYYY